MCLWWRHRNLVFGFLVVPYAFLPVEITGFSRCLKWGEWQLPVGWWVERASNTGAVKLNVVTPVLWHQGALWLGGQESPTAWVQLEMGKDRAFIAALKHIFFPSSVHHPRCQSACLNQRGCMSKLGSIHHFWLSNSTGHWSLFLHDLETGGFSVSSAMGSAFLCTSSYSWNKQWSSSALPFSHQTAFIGTWALFLVALTVAPSEKTWFKPLASLVLLHNFRVFCLWAETILKSKWLYSLEVKSCKMSRIY